MMVSVRHTQWGNLEPEGLGHDLLLEWAPWARDDREGGHSWSVKPRVDPGYHGDPPSRVDRVDRIVARIGLEQPRYYNVICHVYLGEKSYGDAARDLHMTQGWLRTMVLASCGLVEIRYRDLAD